MAVPFGLYRSSGGLNRSLFLERSKGDALSLALPEILQRLRSLGVPERTLPSRPIGAAASPFGRFSDALTPGQPVPSQPSPFFAPAAPSPFFAQPPEVEERRERFAVPFEERETGGGAFGPLGDIAGAIAGVPGDVANRLLRFRGLRGVVEGEPFISEQEAAREGLQVDLSPARLIEPTLTPEQAARLESLPIVGPAVRREAEFLSTPLGLAGTLAFPGATAAGTVGGIAAGTVAEQAGAGETGQLAAQIAGNVLAPGAGLVPRGVVTRPAGALARVGRETVEEAAARARLASEAGGGRLGGRAAALEEQRTLKTLVQEGRATPQQETRLTELQGQLQRGEFRAGEPPIPPREPVLGGFEPEDAPFVGAADPGAAAPPPPRKPPAGPRGPGPDDPQFGRIQEVAIKGEKPEVTLMRRHGGTINTAAREAELLVIDGNKLLRQAKIGQSFRGTVVPKAGQTEEFNELYRFLHNPSRVRSGELVVPERLRPAYDKLRDLTDWEQVARLDFDPEMATVTDYFYRGWKAPEGAFTGIPARGALGRTPGFKLPRVDATFEEMRAAGFEPLFWNPFEQWRHSRMMGIRYREQMRLIDDIKELELAVPHNGGPIPKGWRVPSVGPAFEGKPFAIVDEAGNPRPMFTRRWLVPDSLANRLENTYQIPPDLSTVGVAGKRVDLLKAIDAITFLPKRAKLVASVFQHVDFLNRSHIGAWTGLVNGLRQGKPIRAVQHLAVWPKSAYTMLKSAHPSQRANLLRLSLDDTPLVAGRPGLTNRAISEAGLGLTDVTILPANLDEIAREAVQEAIAAKVLKAPPRAILGLERMSRQNLFQRWYPAAILTDIKNNIAPIMARDYPNLNDPQLAGMIAEAASKKYSAIPGSMSVIQNRFIRETLRRLIFSIAENEGLLRQATGAVKGPQAAFWREHWLGAFLGLTAAANVIHFASTGEPLPLARYSPISRDKWGPLPFGYNQDFAAPNIPLTGRSGTEITLDLVGQLDTALRILDPKGFITARESVPVRTLQNQIEGQDFFGAPIDEVGPGGIVSRTSQFIFDMFAPIGVGQAGLQAARDNIQGAETVIQPGEERLGLAGTALQATGLNVRAETTPQLLDRIRGDVIRERGLQQRYDEIAATDAPLKRQIDDEVEQRVGRELELRRETAELRGQVTPTGQFFELSGALGEEFQAQQLEDDAVFDAGTMDAGVWRKNYGDRVASQFDQREGIARALKVEFKDRVAKPGTVNAAIDAYFDVDLEDFTDKTTGERDWDGFFGVREKALAPLSAQDRARVEEFLLSIDTPAVRDFKAAQDVRNELEQTTSRVIGLKPTQYKELRDWLEDRVAAARRFWLEQSGVNVPLEDAVTTMAKHDGKGPNFRQWALLLRGGVPDELRNPAFDQFLIDNETVLRRFFPELYESQRILEQLGAR